MAKFVAISGPSASGKTTLVDSLSTYPSLSKALFCPDIHNTVWQNLVDQGYFTEYKEIIRDSEYICVYLLKMIEYYEDCIERYKETDSLIFLDCCWLDLFVYGLLNMWCSNTLKDLQGEILGRISKLSDSVDRVYLTKVDSGRQTKQKFREQFKVYSVTADRPLELQYYNMAKSFKYTEPLRTSDPTEASLFIIDDLRKLGYL